MQLLDNPLLFRRGKAAEVGIGAQHLFLLLNRQIAVLIEPVAQVARRALNRRCIAWILRTVNA
jgi:hypothetical protein